jgi:hypothetical protein
VDQIGLHPPIYHLIKILTTTDNTPNLFLMFSNIQAQPNGRQELPNRIKKKLEVIFPLISYHMLFILFTIIPRCLNGNTFLRVM